MEIYDQLLASMEEKRKYRAPPPRSDESSDCDDDSENEMKIIEKKKIEFPYNIIPVMEELFFDSPIPSDFSEFEFSDSSDEEESKLKTVKKEIVSDEPEEKSVKSRIELNEIPTGSRSKKRSKRRREENSSDCSDSESSHASSKHKRKQRNVHISGVMKSEESESDYDSYREKRLPSRHERQNEPDDSENLGHYYCRDCHASMNSRSTWNSHLSGKRHIKNIKLGHVSKAALETISGEVTNRYPFPSPGCTRVKTDEVSRIQRFVETNINPCLGLGKVVEIQGLEDISYYCGLCDSPCSQDTIIPHLEGFKHQLFSLKEIQPALYEAYRYRKKSEVEYKILKILREEHERNPIKEKILVEKDRLYDPSLPGSSRAHESAYADADEPENDSSYPDFIAALLPDTSRTNYYCPTCDSHMNSGNMWESHVRGKRHLKNLKKCPGERPSKVKSVPSPYSKPLLNLDNEEGPIVGLNYIRENQNPEAGETYHCYLCRANCTTIDIVDHLLTPKHMRRYLEQIDDPEFKSIVQLQLSVSSQNNLIVDVCRRVERERGRGNMEIYVSKSPYLYVRKGIRN